METREEYVNGNAVTEYINGSLVRWTELYPMRKLYAKQILTLPAPCISESCIKIKINLTFYFHSSLWCLKRFYEGLKGLHKAF